MLFAMLLSVGGYAQRDSAKKLEQIYENADEMPQPPGGTEGLMKYLQKNLKMPKEAAKAGVNGTVYKSIIVNKKGKIENVMIKRDPCGHGCAEEAMRVIKKMPRWKPGKMYGKPVNVRYIIPVKFVS